MDFKFGCQKVVSYASSGPQLNDIARDFLIKTLPYWKLLQCHWRYNRQFD